MDVAAVLRAIGFPFPFEEVNKNEKATLWTLVLSVCSSCRVVLINLTRFLLVTYLVRNTWWYEA